MTSITVRLTQLELVAIAMNRVRSAGIEIGAATLSSPLVNQFWFDVTTFEERSEAAGELLSLDAVEVTFRAAEG